MMQVDIIAKERRTLTAVGAEDREDPAHQREAGEAFQALRRHIVQGMNVR